MVPNSTSIIYRVEPWTREVIEIGTAEPRIKLAELLPALSKWSQLALEGLPNELVDVSCHSQSATLNLYFSSCNRSETSDSPWSFLPRCGWFVKFEGQFPLSGWWTLYNSTHLWRFSGWRMRICGAHHWKRTRDFQPHLFLLFFYTWVPIISYYTTMHVPWFDIRLLSLW